VAARRGSVALAKHKEQGGMKLRELARSGERLCVLRLGAHSDDIAWAPMYHPSLDRARPAASKCAGPR